MSIIRNAFMTMLLTAMVFAAGVSLANAQNLPQAPNAPEKASQGGLTAGASLEREGGSALEPYLVTWLIPAFGLITFVACVFVDRRMRASIR